MSAPSQAPSTAAGTLLDVSTLVQIASGVATATSLWKPFGVSDSAERTRLRLLATPAYEVWLLGWAPGQSVGLHDHGDANGAFVVVEGSLVETSLVAGHLLEATLEAGGVGRIPIGVVHDVANCSRRVATSIHAYSRPLVEMGFYDASGSRVRIESVEQEMPVVTRDDVARALHPAVGNWL